MRIFSFKLSNHGENKPLSFLSFMSISWFFLWLTVLLVVQNAHGQELLVKFTEQAGSSAKPWADGDGDQSSPRASLHREARARRATPLLKTPRGGPDPLFEASGLSRICAVSLQPGSSLNAAIAIYKSNDKIEYVVPNHSYRILASESSLDSLESQQWGLEKIRAREGWSIERGSREVIVAVVDLGVDYLHPDLAENIWINAAEDVNGNGIFDAMPEDEGGDLNGVDDDGNGFIDDVVGWDFTDSPELPGDGDYTGRDNDPMDQSGSSHGTHVAGIACGVADNGIGIAGVAPGCRIMALRAGASGYLQEDDVSSAIVYAAQNGAAVINMSWGDVVVSPVIQDVLEYAHASGCVLVASAGNSATDAIHYPSGYDQTLSVGNSDSNDHLAGNSNYGATIDVVAPGCQIMSTIRDSSYRKLSGTSMSAPHVSGLAALVRSLHPEFSNEEIRFAIQTGAIDLGTPGRDSYYGAGRIDIPNSLAIDKTLRIEIDEPRSDSGLYHDAAIVGTVAGLGLEYWELSYGNGDNPIIWFQIHEEDARQVVHDTLAIWHIDDVADGRQMLRIVATDHAGVQVERLIPVWIDRTPPEIEPVTLTTVLEGPYWHHLLEFTTDDITSAAVHMRQADSTEDFDVYPLKYETTWHRWLIGPEIPGPGSWELFVSATNTAGLESIEDNSRLLYRVSISGAPLGYATLDPVVETLPPGYLTPDITDFDNDGLHEIVIGEMIPFGNAGKTTLGPMRIFEASSSLEITEVPCGAMQMYPLSAGDADQDGLIEILGTYYVPLVAESTNVFSHYGWESAGPGEFPSRLAWGDSSHVLAVGMSDADGDGWGEIYSIIQGIYPHKAILVQEAVANDSLAVVDTLWNPVDHSSNFVLRGMTSGDFDGDGRREVVFCEDKGSFIGFESVADNEFEFCWAGSSSLGEQGCAHSVVAADLDGDGVDELVGMCRLAENLNLEHNFDARRWNLVGFRSNGAELQPFWETVLFGVITSTGQNGLGAGDLDGDGDDEIAVCAYPDFYVFDYQEAGDSLAVFWYCHGASSPAVIIADLDGAVGPEGPRNELVISFPDHSTVFRAPGAFPGPQPPGFVKATPISSTDVMLQWSAVVSADRYRVYRGRAPDQLEPIIIVDPPEFLDSGLELHVDYWYSVATIDSSSTPSEGALSYPVSVATNTPPELLSATCVPPSHIALEFNEPLDDNSAKEPGHYRLEPGPFTPSSAILTHQNQGVLLAFSSFPEDDGFYLLCIQGVKDTTGVVVPFDTAVEIVIRRETSFYLAQAAYQGDGWISVCFNSTPDSLLASDNLAFNPPLEILEFHRSSADPREFRLLVTPPSMLDGAQYVLTIQDAQDIHGNRIKPGEGDSIGLYFFADDLDSWEPVPNPWRVAEGTTICFTGAPRDATVHLYNLAGRRIASLQEWNADGVVEWDGRDRNGCTVSSGVYLYHVLSAAGKKAGKIVVIR